MASPHSLKSAILVSMGKCNVRLICIAFTAISNIHANTFGRMASNSAIRSSSFLLFSSRISSSSIVNPRSSASDSVSAMFMPFRDKQCLYSYTMSSSSVKSSRFVLPEPVTHLHISSDKSCEIYLTLS